MDDALLQDFSQDLDGSSVARLEAYTHQRELQTLLEHQIPATLLHIQKRLAETLDLLEGPHATHTEDSPVLTVPQHPAFTGQLVLGSGFTISQMQLTLKLTKWNRGLPFHISLNAAQGAASDGMRIRTSPWQLSQLVHTQRLLQMALHSLSIIEPFMHITAPFSIENAAELDAHLARIEAYLETTSQYLYCVNTQLRGPHTGSFPHASYVPPLGCIPPLPDDLVLDLSIGRDHLILRIYGLTPCTSKPTSAQIQQSHLLAKQAHDPLPASLLPAAAPNLTPSGVGAFTENALGLAGLGSWSPFPASASPSEDPFQTPSRLNTSSTASTGVNTPSSTTSATLETSPTTLPPLIDTSHAMSLVGYTGLIQNKWMEVIDGAECHIPLPALGNIKALVHDMTMQCRSLQDKLAILTQHKRL